MSSRNFQDWLDRKYVNPAAIAKLLVLGLLFLPAFMMFTLLPADHTSSINLQNPLTEEVFGVTLITIQWKLQTFGSTLLTCYSTNPMMPYNLGSFENPLPDVLFTMLFAKYHGWIGGFSSILVIAIGLVSICSLPRIH